MDKRYIGRKSAGYNFPVAIAAVIIPNDLEIEEYIKYCLAQNRVVAIGVESAQLFKDVEVALDIMNYIKFPDDKNKFGSYLLLVNIPLSTKMVAVGVLSSTDGERFLNNKFEINYTKGSSRGVVGMVGDTNTMNLSLMVDSNEDSGGELHIQAKNKGRTAKIIIDSFGDVEVNSQRNIVLKAIDSFTINVSDMSQADAERLKVKMSYVSGEGFNYEDEFGNKVIIRENLIELSCQDSSDENTTKVVRVTNESVEIGGDGSFQKSVKGETLKSLLQEILTQIKLITVPTGVGPSGVPINAPAFISIEQRLNDILSTVVSNE